MWWTRPSHVDANLYQTVMYMPSFSEEAMIVDFSHLWDNMSQGRAFVDMVDDHRVLWLSTFLAKNYYRGKKLRSICSPPSLTNLLC
jgi:hypothetical protein